MILRLLLAALATWRVAQFIVLDDGPADFMFRLRRQLGRYTFEPSPEDSTFYQPASAMGRLLECVHCVGKWTALPFAILAWQPTRVGDLVLSWLGLAGAQSLLEGRRDAHTMGRPVKMRVKAGKNE